MSVSNNFNAVSTALQNMPLSHPPTFISKSDQSSSLSIGSQSAPVLPPLSPTSRTRNREAGCFDNYGADVMPAMSGT